MKYRPIGLPLRSRPRRCSSVASSSSAPSERPLPRPRPRRPFFEPPPSLPDRCAERAPLSAPEPDLFDDPRRRRRGSPVPSASPEGAFAAAGPGGGDVGMGIVSPMRGLRTRAFSAASADGRPSLIGSGSSMSLRSSPPSIEAPRSLPPAPWPPRRRCPPREPRRRFELDDEPGPEPAGVFADALVGSSCDELRSASFGTSESLCSMDETIPSQMSGHEGAPRGTNRLRVAVGSHRS